MYDQHVGAHCKECRQKDWLALPCKYCSELVARLVMKFCGEHFKPEAHACTKYSYEDERKLYVPPPPTQKTTYLCVSCRARLTPLNFAYCKDCNLYYCLQHRFHEEHQPPAAPAAKSSSYCSVM